MVFTSLFLFFSLISISKLSIVPFSLIVLFTDSLVNATGVDSSAAFW